MILTCPACATRYFVREGSIPPEGRKVRCAGCGNTWHGYAIAEPVNPEAQVTPDSDPFPSSDEASFSGMASEFDEPTIPNQIRAKAEARRRTREAIAAGVVWAVLCAAFALVLVAAVLFRVQVVRLFPSTAGAYAAVNLPVNPTGLSLENVQGGPGLSNGRATLVVSGVERNVQTDPRPPAPVRLTLYDKAGHRLAEHEGAVEGPALAPGETRNFAVNVFDPPLNVAEFQVEFVLDKPKPAPARSAQHPAARPEGQGRPETSGHEVKLRGEAAPGADAGKTPETARPLPAGSPYALPAAASPAAHAE